MEIKTPYYEDLTRISNSNIGWFLQKGPAYLHKMLTNPPPEEKNYVLERGTLIHMYILQPEEFRNTYVVWDKSRPTSTQQEKFCQALASTLEIEPNRAILSAYKEAYSTAGKSEDKMLSEGQKIASTLKDYINFLKANDGRTMISPYEYQMLEKIKQNVQSHKIARHIIDAPLRAAELCDYEAHHEFHINWEYLTSCGSNTEQDSDEQEVYELHCKSLLDGLTLDFKNKKAIIYDLKTTQKLWHFEDSIDQYDYYRQLAYYSMAVDWYLEEECKEEPLDWTHVYYIIGIDTTGSNEIRVFKVEPHVVQSRMDTIYDALDAIAWHQTTGKWEHSREYYEGDGSETLKL